MMAMQNDSSWIETWVDLACPRHNGDRFMMGR
jgi:hypothetical protein